MTGTAGNVVVLNGGSSSGKTTLARRLQEVLDGTWLRLGVDTLVDAAPPRLLTDDGLVLAADGSVVAGPAFVAAERQWMAGVAAMAAAGALVLVEDSFVSGRAAQRRWADALVDVPVTWVGVHCAPEVAAAREAVRGDRVTGMAARQAEPVHTGISYDLEVDTGVLTTDAAADVVRAHLDANPAAPRPRRARPGTSQ